MHKFSIPFTRKPSVVFQVELSDDLVQAVLFHGLKQKINDAAASTGDDHEAGIEACQKVVDAINAGEWRTGGGGSPLDPETREFRVVLATRVRKELGAKAAAAAKATTADAIAELAKSLKKEVSAETIAAWIAKAEKVAAAVVAAREAAELADDDSDLI